MYQEDKLIGPLTWKQTLVAAAAGVFWRITFPYVSIIDEHIYAILIAIPIGMLIIYLMPAKIELKDIDEYLDKKEKELGAEKFKRFLQKRVAEIQSQIYARKMKGQKEDLDMNEALVVFNKKRDN